MKYFKNERLTDRIIRIIDIANVAMYLVIGDERACLIDTGNGFGNIHDYAASLTDRPIFVVLTHGHIDHANGAALFETVYLNQADWDVYQEHSQLEFRHKLFQQLPSTSDILLSDYNPVRKEGFQPLSDKQVFDLGGITLEMVNVPGHTRGIMMILILEEEIMLFGDACGVSVMLYEDCAATVTEYRQALLRVKKEYESRYTRVIRNHGTFESECDILDHVISCCDDVLANRDDHVPTDVFGETGFFLAKEVDKHGQRVDGLSGNLLYRFDKGI